MATSGCVNRTHSAAEKTWTVLTTKRLKMSLLNGVSKKPDRQVLMLRNHCAATMSTHHQKKRIISR